MKYFLILVLSVWTTSIFAQTIALPSYGYDFYKTIDAHNHFGRGGRAKSAMNLVRETFKERYSPKSIKTDADIIMRVKKYETNPNMRYQDLGWFFETEVKNRHRYLNYVKKSNAHINDLTGRLPDGRFLNAQLKVHHSGNPKTYFKDLKRYNSMLIIPDDHVRPLKNHIKNLIKERSELEKIVNLTPGQQKRLNDLKALKLEQKMNRIRGGGITYKKLNEEFNKGIQKIVKPQTFKAIPTQKIQKTMKIHMKSKNFQSKTIKHTLKGLSGVKYVHYVGFLYTGYVYYDSINKFLYNKQSNRELYRNTVSTTVGWATSSLGAVIGAKIGASVSATYFYADFGLLTATCTVAGGILGYFGGEYITQKGFDYYYARLDKESRDRIEHFVNEFYGYTGEYFSF